MMWLLMLPLLTSLAILDRELLRQFGYRPPPPGPADEAPPDTPRGTDGVDWDTFQFNLAAYREGLFTDLSPGDKV